MTRQQHQPSPRQMQVLRLLAEGADNRQIANHLHITTATASWHVNELRIRLGAVDRADIVTQARQLGVLVPEST